MLSFLCKTLTLSKTENFENFVTWGLGSYLSYCGGYPITNSWFNFGDMSQNLLGCIWCKKVCVAIQIKKSAWYSLDFSSFLNTKFTQTLWTIEIKFFFWIKKPSCKFYEYEVRDKDFITLVLGLDNPINAQISMLFGTLIKVYEKNVIVIVSMRLTQESNEEAFYVKSEFGALFISSANETQVRIQTNFTPCDIIDW